MPLQKHSKAKSLAYLEDNHPEVVPFLWTCEGPEIEVSTDFCGYKACGKCVPCTRRIEWSHRP